MAEQIVYAHLTYPPLGMNDTYGGMRQHGAIPAKNRRTRTWQDELGYILRAAGLKPFSDGKQDGHRVSVYYYLVTGNRDVDSCVKALLDAIAWYLCPRWDSRNRPIYQDSWQGSSYGDKEWGKESLEVWIRIDDVDGKDGFNAVSQKRRALMRAELFQGHPKSELLDRLPHE